MTTERFKIDGPKGRLDAILHLPDGFDRTRDKCTVVILMHGIMPNPVTIPLPHFARALAGSGYVALRFYFYGNMGSDGTSEEVTVPGEIEDARVVYNLVRSWPFADKVVLLGHSQGGVVAGMLAGELQREGTPPDALIQLSPGAVLKDYALEGRLFGLHVDPLNPPARKRVLWYTISREYILTAQTLPIYETSALYTGPVCLCHGTIDHIVPYRYSERYAEGYADARLCPVPGANHFYSFRRRRVDALLLAFLRERLP